MDKQAARAHVLGKMSRAITKSGSGYKVNDLNPRNGIQNFGTYPTKAAANRKLRAIEYFKHGGKR